MVWLKELRERAGLSQTALAELIGTSQPQIQRLERGRRGMSIKWASKIAPVLATIPEELMFGDLTCRIVGSVGAAAEAHFTPTEQILGYAKMPRGGSPKTVAVEVRGDSMGAALDGWIIYYDDRREIGIDDNTNLVLISGS